MLGRDSGSTAGPSTRVSLIDGVSPVRKESNKSKLKLGGCIRLALIASVAMEDSGWDVDAS